MQSKLQQASPDRVFRLRTAIDENHRAAKKDRLFGISYCRTDEHIWRATITLPEKNAAKILKALKIIMANGLAGIGRGGAYAKVRVRKGKENDLIAGTPGKVVLTLQTEALLRRPIENHGGDVTELYREAFRGLGISGTGYELKAIFINEELRGGEFVARRLGNAVYRPWLLTLPGSVFVFHRTNNAPGEDLDVLNSFLRDGIPPPIKTLDFYDLQPGDDLYKTCPYSTDNGYGAVRETTTLWQPMTKSVEYV